MRRGDIYLVNFGKKYNSEFGKIRPALIIQNDVANRNIDRVDFKGVSVIPLSTNICGGDVRVFIKSVDDLKRDSEICINELCTLDLSRITLDKCLATLTNTQMSEVELKLVSHLGLR
jgi:mRNA interferase MazF